MNVLLTKKIPQAQLDRIQSWGWTCEVVETLKITLVDVSEVPSNADAWVVSSRNSFSTIKKFITKAPQRIFCVGRWMENEIEKLKVKSSVRSFENMNLLATDLIKENIQDLIYFCGRAHRDELEQALRNTTAKISKVITHESDMTFPVIKKTFDAIFVFSPRSAESLLKHNSFPKTVFACIGPTTADYLNSRGINKIFVSSYPDSKGLLEEFHASSLTASRK
jgi:uroporphyrinogen-III synthase